MLQPASGLLAGYLIFDVLNPEEIGASSSVSQRFPKYNNAHRYHLRSPPPAQRPEVLTRLAMRPAGDLMAAYVGDTFGTEVEVVEPGVQRYCIAMLLSGAMQMHLPGGREATGSTAHGLIYRGEAGARFLTGNGCARWNLWVEARRVEQALEGLLGRSSKAALAFSPELNFDGGTGASLKGVLGLVSSELAQPDGLAANPVTLASLTDLIVQTMLVGLPHNHRDALERRRREIAMPGTLRRAEAFMRANADQPMTLADVAAAAGCSLRTLHAAFRRFQDTTPLAALQAIRMTEARAALMRCGEHERVMDVARRYGFSNRSRLAAAWLRRFGDPLPRDRDRDCRTNSR